MLPDDTSLETLFVHLEGVLEGAALMQLGHEAVNS